MDTLWRSFFSLGGSDEDMTKWQAGGTTPVQKRKISHKNGQQKGCIIFRLVLLCNQGVAYEMKSY